MNNQKKNRNQPATIRPGETARIQVLGKHVSQNKGRLLLAITLIVCALPVLLGIRLWNGIPEIVLTGLIGIDGQDDSLPRAVLVFGVPGLMCLLNLIIHVQFMVNQKRMALPSLAIRLVGRWGIPIISVLFCSAAILCSAGYGATLFFVTPCLLGLALLLLGSHMLDCPQDTRLALGFLFKSNSHKNWNVVHRFAATVWMIAGLCAIALTMLMIDAAGITVPIIGLAFLIPIVHGYRKAKSKW